MSASVKPADVTTLRVLGQAFAATFRKAWPVFLALAVATLAATLLELAPPFLLKKIIDSYLNAGQLDGLWVAAVLYVLASVGSSAIGFGLVFGNSYIGQNVLLELRFRLAEHLAKLPISYFHRTPVGDTVSRLTSDVETVNAVFSQTQATSMGFSNLPTDIVKIIGILIAMFAISPRLTLVVLAAVPVVYLVSRYFRKNTYRTQLQVRRTVGGINTFLQETFSGVRTVKAYGQEDRYAERFQKPLAGNLQAVNGAAVYDAYFPCVMQVIRAVVIALVVYLGAKTAVDESLAISIGSLAAMADLIGRLFAPIDALTSEFQVLQQALAGLNRIVELLHEKPEEKGTAPRVPSTALARSDGTALQVKSVDYSYRKGDPVLRDVSLTVPRGKRVAIVGRTGAGKTSLLNLIAGLDRPAAGAISVLGYDPYLVDPSDRRKLLGVVPQSVHVFEGTVRENITLRDETVPVADVERAARTVGLHDYIMSLGQGYDTLLGVGGTRLSHGQGQLLSLARAVVSDPAILLLDEPTSGVDAVTEAAIIRAFRQASEDRTIVTISHRLSGILDADEVHIMASGRIVESGAPETLAGQGGWYSKYRQLEALGWQVD